MAYKNPYASLGKTTSNNEYKNPYASMGSSSASQSQYAKMESLEDFEKMAGIMGYKKDKPSIFQRLFKGVTDGVGKVLDFTQRLNYAIAGGAKELVEGGDDALGEAWKGITGSEKDTFSDVLGSAGIENKWVKGIGGFVLDVALDPITYIGGMGLMKRAGIGGKYLTKLGKAEQLNADKAIKSIMRKMQPLLAKDKTGKVASKITSMIKEVGFKLDDVLMKDPDKFFKGITFAGKEMIPRKVALGLYKGTFGQVPDAMAKLAPTNIVRKGYNKLAVKANSLKEGLEQGFSIYAGRKTARAKALVDDIFKTRNVKGMAFDRTTKLYKKMWDKNGLTDKENLRFVEGLISKKRMYAKEINRIGGAKIDKLAAKFNISADKLKAIKDNPKALDALVTDIEKNGGKRIRMYQDLLAELGKKEYKLTKGASKLDDAVLKQMDAIGDFFANKKKLASGLADDEVVDAATKAQRELGEVFWKSDQLEFARVDFLRLQDDMARKARQGNGKLITETGEALTNADKIKRFNKIKADIHSTIEDSTKIIESLKDVRKEARIRVNATALDFSDMGEEANAKMMKFYNDDFSPQLNELSKAAGYTDEPLKYYFPSIDKTKLEDFFKMTSPHGFKQKSMGLYKGAIKDADLIRDPKTAYTLKHQQVITNQLNGQSLEDIVSTYGKTEAQMKAVAGNLAEKWEKVSMNGKTLGYLKEADNKLINGIFYPEINVVDKLAKSLGYDAFTNTFKKAVTAYFPAFHIRNAFSGLIQNYQTLGARVFDPTLIKHQVGVMGGKSKVGLGMFESKGFTGTYRELQEKILKRFGMSSQFAVDFTGDINNPVNFKKMGIARKGGDLVELNQKVQATIVALTQGSSLDDALKLAEKAGFDYGKVTKFEQGVMKRLIPFYSFARKNAGLQLSTAVENPGRILNQVKFPRMLSNIFGGKPSEEDMMGIPPWARDALGFKINDGQIVSNFDAPVKEFLERITDPFGSTLNSINPLIKYPIEGFAGFDFFRGEKVAEINKIDPNLAKMIESDKTPGFIKNLFDISYYDTNEDGKQKRVYKADPYALHFLRSIPISRFQGSIQRIFSDDEQAANKMLSFLIGAKIYDINNELQNKFNEKDLMNDWMENVERHGIGYTQENMMIDKAKARAYREEQE